MKKWLEIPETTKRNAYIQIAEATGMSPFAVEKDWWVVQTLSIVFDMDISKHLVFKGGTSLSKAWNLLDRFSEDIDLAIDRNYFGYRGDLTKSQITQLRKDTSSYTSGPFLDALQQKFKEKGISDVKFNLVEAKDSDQDPRIIQIYYPNVIAPTQYLEAKVEIEIGCRSLREPFTIQSFRSLLDDAYPDLDFAQPHIMVPSVNPERTFLEKIFLLHEEFQRPSDKIRFGKRLSRHLYDIATLSKTPFAAKALSDQELYKTIVEHRYRFTKLAGVDYNNHKPQTINPIPSQEVLDDWKSDYENTVEQMIYEANPPSFDEIMSDLMELKQTINNLSWNLDQVYPIPIK